MHKPVKLEVFKDRWFGYFLAHILEFAVSKGEHKVRPYEIQNALNPSNPGGASMFELSTLEKFVFVLIAGVFGSWAVTYFYRIFKAITRGQADPDDRFDNIVSRVGAALWTTLTQQRVFRDRIVVSALHSFIFFGFTFYLLVNLIDALEAFFGLDVTSVCGSDDFSRQTVRKPLVLIQIHCCMKM
jgi:branched-subunit amino acid transport protein